MNILITARGFDITDNIKDYIEEAIKKHTTKFFIDDSTVNIKMILSKDGNLFNSTIGISDVKSEFIRISKTSDTAYNAIDDAVSHLCGKLQKHKGERINKYRHNKNSVKAQMRCFGYVLDSNEIEKYDVNNISDSGLIIEEDVFVKTMTIGDAIMEMELLSLPAFLFINAKSNRINMIYAKSDGNIMWVDPLNISPIK
ncbi:ribosomal subunit interface protein [Ehrlichia chaffeensis str. Heartland]|uniref:Ribosome hibernation promoting factor n=1 Tax=Ehrlichia chaffeensis (strain ATCC CRL-10679 / Arkansas) TaxID=205920 RepID=Q2GGH0_EHRCR|nr:ribosome-associated translation inhibitor RaiA [Ehrlichia chaffeensis]ABD45273.1 putative ribosomal subunit interface protein [Ehrlichia chaffeensis str. Arkansas]AHX03734.1 ribosomal subunit interface protein [Ehrlichia chaffeensis str. Heartland]AHX05545.1 ribosomal subunit interface protein [Ehrlichia chaffeensis str. Jax]AHX06535.1 ribosomal subunit interface protein [Ehrlichia chaffeensis str. Liberty]AHX07287.1 ribosomal subunit interface protein [Ehrlichia chaffeensis str. Osceola]